MGWRLARSPELPKPVIELAPLLPDANWFMRGERVVSDAAWRAAHDALDATDGQSWAGATRSTMVNLTLGAAHDRALGLDRSVCLREVIAHVHNFDGNWDERDLADYITERFA